MRAVIACLVILGPLAWLHRHRILSPGWHPLLVLSAFSVLTLVGGVAGQLRLGAFALVASSLALLAWELRVDRQNVLATVRAPSAVVFGASAAALTVLLRGQVVTHYDNFSHWALVVSVMLDTHALPTPSDDVVTFTTYPLGAASLLYLGNVVLGSAESVSMLVHDLFAVSCVLPFVTLAGRRWGVGTVLYLLASLALLTSITTPTSLLVDSLVAGLAGALLVLTLLDRTALMRSPWAFSVLAAALLSIKTSGLLFVAVATIVMVLVVVTRHRPDGPRGWAVWAATLSLPWLVWWLWGWHVGRTFSDAADSKHSVSAERFGDVRGEKSPEDVRSILEQLATGTAGDILFWVLLGALVVMSALAVRSRALTTAELRCVLAVVVATVVLWEVSLALMYLYSMPLGEALALAGFARYQGTIYLVMMVVLLAVAARWSAVVTRLAAPQVLGAAAAVTIPVALMKPLGLVPPPPQSEPRASLERTLAGTDVAPQDEVCVLLSEPDAGYRGWIVKYTLSHGNVRNHVIPEDEAALPERISTCDLIVLLDDSEHTAQLLRAGGWDVTATPTPQIVRRS